MPELASRMVTLSKCSVDIVKTRMRCRPFVAGAGCATGMRSWLGAEAERKPGTGDAMTQKAELFFQDTSVAPSYHLLTLQFHKGAIDVVAVRPQHALDFSLVHRMATRNPAVKLAFPAIHRSEAGTCDATDIATTYVVKDGRSVKHT